MQGKSTPHVLGTWWIVVFAGWTTMTGAQDTAFRRADANSDGETNLADAVFTLQYLFADGTSTTCRDAADANDDGLLNITDPIFTLGYLFSGGPAPPPPTVECGQDPTADTLDCARFVPCADPTAARVIISEFMASNTRTLRDGDREYSDWIEIENVGEIEVDLEAWALTDNLDDPFRWRFHTGADIVLAPGERLLVFASGAESDTRVDRDGYLHTSFELDADGESFALVNPDGEIVSSFRRVPEQTADVAYGLALDALIAEELVGERTDARYLAATAPVPSEWTDLDFDASEWSEDDLGFGYDTSARGLFSGKFETDVEAEMRGVTASLYVRAPFTVNDHAAIEELTLWVRHDGGYVAFLNGTEVARANAPAGADHASQAVTPRPDDEAVTGFAKVGLTDRLDLVTTGSNVLAIHALSDDESSERFLILPILEGRVRGDAQTYLLEPTPGEPNAAGMAGRVRDTEFSVDRGFHDAGFDVALTTATPGTTILYTTNGRDPARVGGAVYEGPIRTASVTVLRAVAQREGFVPTDVDTHTYLFLEGPGGVLRQSSLPPGYPDRWAGVPADYEMDPEIVDHPDYRDSIADDLRSLPALSVVLDPVDFRWMYDNSTARGLASERSVSVELFTADGSEELQVNSGFRVHGGAGRQARYPKHSFRLNFRRRYGPGKLRHPLFRGQLYGAGATESFDKLILRAGFNNTVPHWYDEQMLRSQYVRDQWARDMQFEMGHLSPRGRYAHLYLNGMYWGLYNITERPDEDFGASYYGGTEDDYDVIKNRSTTAGTGAAWSRLVALAANPTDPARWDEIQTLCDLEELVDYMLENIYFGNTDWDHNNQVALRRSDPPAPFTFPIWDAEFAISLPPGSQPNQWAPILSINKAGVNNQNAPSAVFQGLRRHPDFAMLVADRVRRLFYDRGVLTPERLTEIWMRRADEVHGGIVGESARWGDFRRDVFSDRDPQTNFPLFTRNEQYLEHRRWILEEYFPQRTEIVLAQLAATRYFSGAPVPELRPHGGRVTSGAEITLSATRGLLYYTVDGSDPRLPGGDISPTAILAGDASFAPIVDAAVPVRAFVPGDDSLGLDWIEAGFDDAGWQGGLTGVGYDTRDDYQDLIGTDVLGTMHEKASSIYMRIEFDLATVPELDFVTLRMKYDDGYAAYLNGTEVARRNTPEEPLAWSSEAARSHSDSLAREFEDVDITVHRDLLHAGTNVLAIHGLNRRATDSDFIVLPQLAVNSAAEAGITIAATTRIRARSLSEGVWSPLVEAIFEVDSGLRVTEVMYHPADPTAEEEDAGFDDQDDFEYVEIANIGSATVNIDGYSLASGIRFEFGALALASGEHIVVVEDAAAFEARYGSDLRIVGQYSGKLGNAGDEILLLDRSADPLHPAISFVYDDVWYPETDGDGFSLVLADSSETADWSDAASWRPSRARGGSPGAAE